MRVGAHRGRPRRGRPRRTPLLQVKTQCIWSKYRGTCAGVCVGVERRGGERERQGECARGRERERERENIIDRDRDDNDNDNDKVSLLLAPHIHNSLSVSSRCCQGGKPPWDPHSPHHWDWQTPTNPLTHLPTSTLDPNLNTLSAHRDCRHTHKI